MKRIAIPADGRPCSLPPAPRRAADLGAAMALIVGLACIGAGSAHADLAEAQAFVEATASELIAVTQSTEGGEEAHAEAFAKLLDQRTSLSGIARYTAGRTTWRSMSKGQRDRYTAALRGWAARLLARRTTSDPFTEFEVLRATPLPNNGEFLIGTNLVESDNDSVRIDWRIASRDGQYRIVDLIFSGVSLLVTSRAQITAILAKKPGDIEALIANLEAREAD